MFIGYSEAKTGTVIKVKYNINKCLKNFKGHNIKVRKNLKAATFSTVSGMTCYLVTSMAIISTSGEVVSERAKAPAIIVRPTGTATLLTKDLNLKLKRRNLVRGSKNTSPQHCL